MEEDFTEGDILEVISFSNKNIKFFGKYISIDDKSNITIELINGTRIIVKRNNIQRVNNDI